MPTDSRAAAAARPGSVRKVKGPPMYRNILTEIDAGVGIITLNRPERHNAFDDILIRELIAAVAAMAADDAVRVLVISSTGKSFSAGADLDWVARAAAYS